jgi:hypothetical protein
MRRTTKAAIGATVVLLIAAALWIGGAALWRWLLALHGVH